MAAITPATTQRVSVGSVNMVIANFTTAADGDTWASGITNRVSHWAQGTGDPSTQTSAGINVAHSAGTFTFYPSEDSLAFTLFVLIE